MKLKGTITKKEHHVIEVDKEELYKEILRKYSKLIKGVNLVDDYIDNKGMLMVYDGDNHHNGASEYIDKGKASNEVMDAFKFKEQLSKALD